MGIGDPLRSAWASAIRGNLRGRRRPAWASAIRGNLRGRRRPALVSAIRGNLRGASAAGGDLPGLGDPRQDRNAAACPSLQYKRTVRHRRRALQGHEMPATARATAVSDPIRWPPRPCGSRTHLGWWAATGIGFREGFRCPRPHPKPRFVLPPGTTVSGDWRDRARSGGVPARSSWAGEVGRGSGAVGRGRPRPRPTSRFVLPPGTTVSGDWMVRARSGRSGKVRAGFGRGRARFRCGRPSRRRPRGSTRPRAGPPPPHPTWPTGRTRSRGIDPPLAAGRAPRLAAR